MLERVEMGLAEQRARFAAIHGKLLAARFANGQHQRLSRYLAAAQEMTTKPLRISVVGELNAGKTELANLILGVQLLPTSVINNTLCPAIIRYGEVQSVRHYRDEKRFEETDASGLHRLVQREGYRVECDLPLPLLRSIEIADLPPFQTLAFRASRVSSLLWRSDILVWCSRATKAWTASEKTIWLQLPRRLKANCLFVLTHADKLSADALQAVIERVTSEIPTAEGAAPLVLATPLAISARSPRGQIMNPKLWTASGGERFFKKLSDLLQNALGNRQSRIEKNTNRILSSVLDDPVRGDGGALMREWMTLQRFFAVNGDDASAEQTAAAAIEAIARFRHEVFEPWLRLHNCPEAEIEAILRLLPQSVAELGPTSRHRLAERLPLIFQQLTAEIEESRTRAA
jgi:hypothetical protein